MVKVVGVPVHETLPLLNVGVTVIVPEIGAVVVLVAVNAAIPVALPPLLAANPIAGFEFVQVYVVVPPVLTVLKTTAVV